MRCELIAVEGFTLEAFQIYQWFQHDVLGYREKTEKKDGRNQQALSCIVSNPEVFGVYNWKYIEVEDEK